MKVEVTLQLDVQEPTNVMEIEQALLELLQDSGPDLQGFDILSVKELSDAGAR